MDPNLISMLQSNNAQPPNNPAPQPPTAPAPPNPQTNQPPNAPQHPQYPPYPQQPQQPQNNALVPNSPASVSALGSDSDEESDSNFEDDYPGFDVHLGGPGGMNIGGPGGISISDGPGGMHVSIGGPGGINVSSGPSGSSIFSGPGGSSMFSGPGGNYVGMPGNMNPGRNGFGFNYKSNNIIGPINGQWPPGAWNGFQQGMAQMQQGMGQMDRDIDNMLGAILTPWPQRAKQKKRNRWVRKK